MKPDRIKVQGDRISMLWIGFDTPLVFDTEWIY